MKRLLYAVTLAAVIGLIGCGSKVDDKETSAVNNAQTQTKAETGKEAAEETKQNTEAQSSTSTQKTAVSLRALAAGNSLVEEQVERVVKNWKQNNNVSDFNKKLSLVYAEYEKLGTSSAEAELSKIGLSLQGHEYCGNGKLDMVEWINKYMK